QFFQAVALLLGRQRQGLQHRQKVFFAGKLSENRGFLWEVADAAARPLVHRQVGNILAIRPEQTHYFPLSDFQLDVIDYLASPVGLAEIDALECGHSSSRGIAGRSPYFWTRCLVSVREPFPESTTIVSSAKKKVNSRPLVVPCSGSKSVGFPPLNTNFWSAAVYTPFSAVPRRSPCSTITPPVPIARLIWDVPSLPSA